MRLLRRGTDLGSYDILGDDSQGASRKLSDAGVSETEVLNQSGFVANQFGSSLGTRKRCDGVSLAGIDRRESNHGEAKNEKRTMFPITRTGFFNFEKSKGGRRSTERTGHPKL